MSKLLMDDNPLCVSPKLAAAIGLNEAIALQQVHYWIEKAKIGAAHNYRDGRWWVYNTIENWKKDNFPFWSESTIRRAFESLQEKGILLTGNYNKTPYDRTIWYSIDYDALTNLLNSILSKGTNGDDQNEQADNANLDTPIPETTGDYADIARGDAEFSGSDLLDAFGLHGPDWPERGQMPKVPPVGERPWVQCAKWMRARDGISAESLQRVYWLIESGTGLTPTDSERGGWAKALAMIYQAANGDFDAIERGVRVVWAREQQFRPGHARGLVDEVRKAAQTREPKDPQLDEFARLRQRMENDPQYQTFDK